MELRIGIQEGLLDKTTHKLMKMMTSYISHKYEIWPAFMDLEAIFEVDEQLCAKIIDDVKSKFKRQLRYIEVACL
jgi:hypothetical protein